MTNSRKATYWRKWVDRECKVDIKMRKKQYHRRARHTKITEDSSGKELKGRKQLVWVTYH